MPWLPHGVNQVPSHVASARKTFEKGQGSNLLISSFYSWAAKRHERPEQTEDVDDLKNSATGSIPDSPSQY